MKVHFEGSIAGYGMEVEEKWRNEKLIPHKTKKCTGTMMSLGNEQYFTDDMDKVTCGLCIRCWNKFAKEN